MKHVRTDPACRYFIEPLTRREIRRFERSRRGCPVCVPSPAEWYERNPGRRPSFDEATVYDYATADHDASCEYPRRPCVCSVAFPSLLRRDGSTT